MENISLKIIDHGSADYREMIKLRLDVLLNPINISEDYIDQLKEKSDTLIGAYIEKRLIGCCILTRIDNNIVQLRQMAVLIEYQGYHIGRKLLHFAEEIALEKGFGKIIMHARNPVIDFYKKCGYEIEGKEFFEVGIGHHNMGKNIKI